MKDVNALREALPYINRFKGKTFVVKFGGEVADGRARLESFCEELALLSQVGIKLVVVHGGGRQATELSSRLGVESVMVNGRRVTDEHALDVAKMVFGGKLNTEILGALRNAGAAGVGLSGVDGGLILAGRRPPQHVVDDTTGEERTIDYGLVGDILEVDCRVLTTLVEGGFVPVIASLAADDQGNIYNVNADTVASAIASALGAEKWIIATSVDGVLDASNERISRLTLDCADQLVRDRVVRGGMIPKLDAARAVIEAGVRSVHLINGLTPGSLLGEVFTDGGNGTMIVA